MAFPVEKDKTDSHLALDYCLEHKARRIDIVQPYIGEPDHYTANLMLLSAARSAGRSHPQIRLMSYGSEVRFLKNETVAVKDAVGDTVSVIPLSPSIHYTCRGTAFDVKNLRVRRGDTVSTRNHILGRSASFHVSGEAWWFRVFDRE